VVTLGVFAPVTLERDGCREHEEGRERIHIAKDIPGRN
jgi:hypothetical protein